MKKIHAVRESFCKDCGDLISKTDVILPEITFLEGIQKNSSMYNIADKVPHIYVDSVETCVTCQKPQVRGQKLYQEAAR